MKTENVLNTLVKNWKVSRKKIIFFRLPNIQKQLIDLIESDTLKITPNEEKMKLYLS